MRRLHIAWLWLALAAALPCAAADRALTLTPPAGSGVFAPTFFGLHVHNNGQERNWPDIPIGSIRLWDARVGWSYLEPKQGAWEFSRLDEYVNWAEQRGIEILLPLGVTPRWASARPDETGAYGPGTAAEPADMARWRAYVSKVADRYRGRVAAYEISNEANIKNFYSGSPQNLAQMVSAAAEEIRRADPAAKVIAPSGVGLDHRVAWPSQILGQGVAAQVAAASFHSYHGGNAPEAMIEPLLKLRTFNKAAGFEAMPMWDTEFGYTVTDDIGPRSAEASRDSVSPETLAEYLPRDLILAAALGFQRFYWYSWDNKTMGLIDPVTHEPRRAAKAYAQTIRLLKGSTLESCDRNSAGLWICKLKSATGGRMAALWIDPNAQSRRLTIESPLQGKWVRLDGVSSWTAPNAELTIVPTVTLISDQK